MKLWSPLLSSWWPLILLLLRLYSLVSGDNAFEPYEVNGGSVCAVAGKQFCIVAADTRMSGSGYLLHSRNHIATRLWTVTDDPIMNQLEDMLRSSTLKLTTGETLLSSLSTAVVLERRLPQAPIFIGSSGCTADCRGLQMDLRADLRVAGYLGQAQVAQPHQMATSLSQMLYQRRGFPYYAFCVMAALDPKTRCGHVYVYDAIGSYEQVAVATSGTGREALQPILDGMFETRKDSPCQVVGDAETAVKKVCQAYRSVSEREIEVGDKLVLHVSELQDDGTVACRILIVPLKED